MVDENKTNNGLAECVNRISDIVCGYREASEDEIIEQLEKIKNRKEKFIEDLMKHLNTDYEKYKHVGINDTYPSGFCGATIGIMNWINEYEFKND